MAFRLRYSFNVDYIPAGVPNQFSGNNVDCAGNMQTAGFVQTPGGQGAGTFTSADITAMTNAAAADMAAQLNAVLARVQAWPTGGL